MTKLKKEALFYPHYEGSSAYRIPSMITTTKGTIIAGIDARIVSSADNPNKINTRIRRSTDNGQTWDPVQELVTFPGEGLDGAAAIDTSLLQDEETGTIWMLYSHTPGGIGLWVSEPGIGFDDEGRRLLFDAENNTYALGENGIVYDQANQETAYRVDENGYVTYDGEASGNMYYKKGVDPKESLLEARTTFLQVIKSDDDGLTWSDPIELNSEVKEDWMCFFGTGPGRGLQLKQGDKKGRLVFPVYYSNPHRKMSCALIYSDDHGQTWQRGSSPNDGRVFKGQEIKAEDVAIDDSDLTESQVIEMPNGDLHVYMRNHSGQQRTAIATSKDGGEAWTDFRYDEALLDPTCQATILSYPDQGDGKHRVLFVNPADEEHRRNGTVRLSEDGGKTWPYSKQIEEGGFIYSCLTVLENGEIGLLYETGPEYAELKDRKSVV